MNNIRKLFPYHFSDSILDSPFSWNCVLPISSRSQHHASQKIDSTLTQLDTMINVYRAQFPITANDMSHICVSQVFLEILLYFDSLGITISQLQGKKVLFIGVNYGIEVILLRELGVNAFGIENDPLLYHASLAFASLSHKYSETDTQNIFIQENIEKYAKEAPIKYHYLIARNLNPLSNVSTFLPHLKNLFLINGKGIVHWDAIFQESIAFSLYAPKKGIYYHEQLRINFDALANKMHSVKNRYKFFYLIK